jgi:hypothetical protein
VRCGQKKTHPFRFNPNWFISTFFSCWFTVIVIAVKIHVNIDIKSWCSNPLLILTRYSRLTSYRFWDLLSSFLPMIRSSNDCFGYCTFFHQLLHNKKTAQCAMHTSINDCLSYKSQTNTKRLSLMALPMLTCGGLISQGMLFLNVEVCHKVSNLDIRTVQTMIHYIVWIHMAQYFVIKIFVPLSRSCILFLAGARAA